MVVTLSVQPYPSLAMAAAASAASILFPDSLMKTPAEGFAKPYFPFADAFHTEHEGWQRRPVPSLLDVSYKFEDVHELRQDDMSACDRPRRRLTHPWLCLWSIMSICRPLS